MKGVTLVLVCAVGCGRASAPSDPGTRAPASSTPGATSTAPTAASCIARAPATPCAGGWCLWNGTHNPECQAWLLGHSTPADAWGIAGSTHGGYDIIHSDGTAWFPVSGSHVACGPVPGYLQYGLGGPDDDASFGCAGDDRIAHWDGVGWVLVPAAGSTPSPPPAVPGEVIATWNAAPGTTFALGYLVSPVTAADPNGADFHLDDRIWRGQRADVLDGIGSGRFLATLYREDLSGAIWGPRGDDGWASLAGTYHWNGMAWTAVSCGPTHSPCIWGSASDDVWASMYYRNYPHEIWRWDGATWSVVATSDYLACGVGAWAHDTHGGLWRRDTRSP